MPTGVVHATAKKTSSIARRGFGDGLSALSVHDELQLYISFSPCFALVKCPFAGHLWFNAILESAGEVVKF